MKIVKLDGVHRAQHLNAAFASNFVDMPAIRISDDGQSIGELGTDFLLAGLIGVASVSIFAIGIVGNDGCFSSQGISVQESVLVRYLEDALHGYPGIRSVEFSVHDCGGVCYLVSIQWDSGLIHCIRDALGAVYQTKGHNFLPEAPIVEDFYASKLSEQALTKYLELRRHVAPHAIELRFDVSVLPGLLGLRAERSTASAAEAAFGRNGGVASAIYVRVDLGPHLSRPLIGALIGGNNRERPQSIKNLALGRSAELDEEQPARGWHEAKKVVTEHGYSLGSDIFEIVESLNGAVCQSNELFRHNNAAPDNYDDRRFASAIRELVVNSFCHGHWQVTECGRERDNNDHNEATRLAIVHAGNRLELINSLRPWGYLHDQTGFETATRRSALHDALRDIGFAKGRSLGQKLVRQRLANLGFSSPIFARQRGVFRAIVPLSRPFKEWGYPVSASAVSAKEIGQLYALKLALFLREVDQDVIASCLYIQPIQAVELLDGLARTGALAKKIPDNAGHWWGYSKYLLPTYEVADDAQAHELIDGIINRMNMVAGPGYMSVGALYQLSVRSIAHLTTKDLEAYLTKAYAGEAVNDADAERLATGHMTMLRVANVLRYPDR